MIRFPQLEKLGASLAIMSDKSDGDCRLPAPGAANELCSARETFCRRNGIDIQDLVCAGQVHGTTIRVVDGPNEGPREHVLHGCDGLLTASAHVAVGVTVADCVPVFLYDPKKRAGGLVHAGREGTRNGIAAQAVRKLAATCGSDPADVHALIGPSAGPQRYEVSEAIAEEWGRAGLPRQGRYLDLWEANRTQLATAGLAPKHIIITGICTISDPRFFSYRGEDTPCRNLAVFKP